MELANEFEVQAPLADTWELLMDVPRVIPCLPGAELIDAGGEDRWQARIKVRIGPMSMLFVADVHRPHADAEARTVRLVTTAREAKGRGQARATIDSSLRALGGEQTRIDVITDLALSGKIAQFGRGAVEDVAEELLARFTANIADVFEVGARSAGGPAALTPEEIRAAAGEGSIGAIGLLLAALCRRLRRGWRRLTGRERAAAG